MCVAVSASLRPSVWCASVCFAGRAPCELLCCAARSTPLALRRAARAHACVTWAVEPCAVGGAKSGWTGPQAFPWPGLPSQALILVSRPSSAKVPRKRLLHRHKENSRSCICVQFKLCVLVITVCQHRASPGYRCGMRCALQTDFAISVYRRPEVLERSLHYRDRCSASTGQSCVQPAAEVNSSRPSSALHGDSLRSAFN